MLKHNTYFDGKVQSVGFERNGARATVGVIDAGTFRIERMDGRRVDRVRFTPRPADEQEEGR